MNIHSIGIEMDGDIDIEIGIKSFQPLLKLNSFVVEWAFVVNVRAMQHPEILNNKGQKKQKKKDNNAISCNTQDKIAQHPPTTNSKMTRRWRRGTCWNMIRNFRETRL